MAAAPPPPEEPTYQNHHREEHTYQNREELQQQLLHRQVFPPQQQPQLQPHPPQQPVMVPASSVLSIQSLAPNMQLQHLQQNPLQHSYSQPYLNSSQQSSIEKLSSSLSQLTPGHEQGAPNNGGQQPFKSFHERVTHNAHNRLSESVNVVGTSVRIQLGGGGGGGGGVRKKSLQEQVSSNRFVFDVFLRSNRSKA